MRRAKFSIILLSLIFSLNISFAEEIKIASVLAVTGEAGIHGNELRKGIELALDELKLQGVNVKYQLEDDQTKNYETVGRFKNLISKGYKFFIGPTWSYQVKAAKPVIERERVLTLAPISDSTIVGGSSDYIFNLWPRRTRVIPSLADYMKKIPDIKALILTSEGEWGNVHRHISKEAITLAGGKVVSDIKVNYGTDLSSLKNILLRESKHGYNLVAFTGDFSLMSNFCKARKQLQMNFKILAEDTFVDAYRAGILPKDIHLEDIIVVNFETPVSQHFLNLYERKFGKYTLKFSEFGYDATHILVKAIQEKGDDVDQVREYLRDEIDYQGAIGKIGFDEYGDLASANYKVNLALELLKSSPQVP